MSFSVSRNSTAGRQTLLVESDTKTERKKYRENGGWGHISTDPRVFRGRTPGVPQKGDEKLQVSKVKLPATAAANRAAAAAALNKTATISSSAVEQKRSGAGKYQRVSVAELHSSVQVTRPPRKELSLEYYLTEQPDENDYPGQPKHRNASTETDEFVPQAPEPAFVPIHLDVTVTVTQSDANAADDSDGKSTVERKLDFVPIVKADGITQTDSAELFDYDAEIEPLINVLTDKVLDQSMMEVREETELALIKTHEAQLRARFDQEKRDIAEMEHQERRRVQEKKDLIDSTRARLITLHTKTRADTAQAIARKFFSCMQHHVMGDLERKNFFFDPVHRQVQAIIPSLLKWVDDRLTQKAQATSFIDDLITQRLAAQQKATEEVDTVIAQQRSEEQRRRMVIQLYIHSAMVGDQPVGPLRLVADATIGDVEDKVVEWMKANMAKPPQFATISLRLNDGTALDKAIKLWEVGVENLSGLQMDIQRPPSAAVSEKAGGPEVDADQAEDADAEQQKPNADDEEDDDEEDA